MAGMIFLFLGLTAFAHGAVVPAVLPAAAPLAKLEEFDAAPQYSFAYDVQDAVTGDSKAQYETRNGDIVRGSYSLIEADGTRRIVEYTADPINGFNAIVSREPVIAAVAAPLRPAALAPIAPASFGPAALTPVAPSIPASGPDSDVEVVEARTSGLSTSARATTREQEIQRQQFQRLQVQQRQQQERQLQEQQRQSSRLQIQQQEQQQDRRQQAAASARTTIAGQEQQPAANARLIGLPARAIATYPTYPYSAAFYSPFAYAAPLTGLAYNPTTALA
ncbi:cuticular protein 3 [Polyergus mexicanus]|uniref:cuticular protein 3 n=1 Tax=Polyergus mexicanus TaxID=615972 RepID=UPI0038B4DC15